MVSESNYNLVLSYDYNTSGHTQWFYFKVISKLKAGSRVTFNIVNLMKPDSLYNYGMKPCVFSLAKQKATGTGWHRACDTISYSRNSILRVRGKEPPEGARAAKLAQYFYFTLSFTYTFEFDNDEVSFAHAVPYTYSGHLLPFLEKIGKEEKHHSYLRMGTLWKTLAKNDWKMMIITDNVKAYRNWAEDVKWYEN